MGASHPENQERAERRRLRERLWQRNNRKAEMLDGNGHKLKVARSQAEVQALHQRNIQIILTATNVVLAGLTCLRVFGIL